MKKEILIGADHAGFELKQALIAFLRDEGHEVTDMGATKLEEGDDYPAILAPLAMKMAMNPEKSIGIVIGGSGTGEAIISNRFPGVRAAVFYGPATLFDGSGSKDGYDIIRLAREHNDANVISLGARFVSVDVAKKAVKIFLETPFPGDERNVRRIAQIDDIE